VQRRGDALTGSANPLRGQQAAQEHIAIRGEPRGQCGRVTGQSARIRQLIHPANGNPAVCESGWRQLGEMRRCAVVLSEFGASPELADLELPEPGDPAALLVAIHTGGTLGKLIITTS
jgi:hypothetical protein